MTKTFEGSMIDAEFSALIPPLSAEERQQLEENIVEHGGARDPLVVWVHDSWMPDGCESRLVFDKPSGVLVRRFLSKLGVLEV